MRTLRAKDGSAVTVETDRHPHALAKRIRAADITQEDAARRIGISRPQLANALQRRYGLSVEVASRLVAFLERPPPVRQLELC